MTIARVVPSSRTACAAIMLVEKSRKLDPAMQAQTMMTFLMVAENPGIAMKAMQERLGVARSTMSRNVAALSKIGDKRGREGYGLIETCENPEDRKQKQVYLTAKRNRLYANMLTYMRLDDRTV